MIAGRRARKRPLIRTGVMMAVIARSLSSADNDLAKYGTQDGNAPNSGRSVMDLGHTTPIMEYSASDQPDMTRYLRQLSSLHAAGVLTDDEFKKAKGRLFGS